MNLSIKAGIKAKTNKHALAFKSKHILINFEFSLGIFLLIDLPECSPQNVELYIKNPQTLQRRYLLIFGSLEQKVTTGYRFL